MTVLALAGCATTAETPGAPEESQAPSQPAAGIKLPEADRQKTEKAIREKIDHLLKLLASENYRERMESIEKLKKPSCLGIEEFDAILAYLETSCHRSARKTKAGLGDNRAPDVTEARDAC